MSKLIEIKSEEQWNEHTSSLPQGALQIVYFHASWATPCKNMTTVLQTLASSYPVTGPLSTSWVSMDAEEVVAISDFFDVTAVPYLVLTRNNQVLETVSGSDAAKVRATIEKHATALGDRGVVAITAANDTTASKNLNSNARSSTAPSTTSQSLPGEENQNEDDLNKRLTTLVKAAPVMLFMKGVPSAPQCGFSRQLVALLRENSVKYGFFNVLADDEVRQGLKEFADWPTFPQLWIDGELVGGLDIVKEEMINDPEFLKAYSVAKSTGSPAATTHQAAPVSATS